MTKFRWRTTILLIGIIAAFLSLASYWNVSPVMATGFLLLSLLLLIAVALFGKRGV
jgi:hypothetical protein